MYQEEVERNGEVCNSFGDENELSHHLPNLVLSNVFLTAFTFKENSEYKQRKLLFL